MPLIQNYVERITAEFSVQVRELKKKVRKLLYDFFFYVILSAIVQYVIYCLSAVIGFGNQYYLELLLVFFFVILFYNASYKQIKKTEQ